MADTLPYPNAGGDVAFEDNTNDFYNGSGGYGNNPAAGGLYNNVQGTQRPRYPGLYVGNLTWWTTDRDVMDAINSIGVEDVQEVKFFENRNNGQSKGFCVVTFASEASLPIVMEKLPTKWLHGQNPVVSPYSRQNLHLFENQNKPRPQINSTNGPTSHGAGIMGINSITGVHAAAAAAANSQVAAATAVANIPYASVNQTVGATPAVGLGYNQATLGINSLTGAGGPRPFHHTMRMPMQMQMRGPRPMIRGSMMGTMNNGPMMTGGHQMNRMRFMSQRHDERVRMVADERTRLVTDDRARDDRARDDRIRDDRIRDDRVRDDRVRDDRVRDDRVRDDRVRDDRSSKQDDRVDRLRRDDRSSRKVEDDRSSRRSDERRERDDRSSRREEKSSSSRHHRERSHRSSDRGRSRSRSKDRSREGKSDRRDRDRERDRDRRERY